MYNIIHNIFIQNNILQQYIVILIIFKFKNCKAHGKKL